MTPVLWTKGLQILRLAIRDFRDDHVALRASALTLYSLLSIVPVMALAFGIAKGFGLQDLLQTQIMRQVPEQEAMLKQIITFAKRLLDDTRGGVVAGAGVVLLFGTMIKALWNIEESFNSIWRVARARTIPRKISDYLSVMLVCPVLLVLSGGITIFLSGELTVLGERLAAQAVAASLIVCVVVLMTNLLSWVLFSFLYLFLPNTRVDWKTGIIVGIVMGTVYQVLQWAYVHLQIGVSHYNAIYGSFAALPLFLVWLQSSWLIVLFGAELCFHHQNSGFGEKRCEVEELSMSKLKLTALHIVYRVVGDFCTGHRPWTPSQIARQLGFSLAVTEYLVAKLVQCGVLVRVAADNEQAEAGLLPACDPTRLSIGFVTGALEDAGTADIALPETRASGALVDALCKFRERILDAPENKLLKEL